MLDNPQAFSGLDWWTRDTSGPGIRSFTQPMGTVGNAGLIALEVNFNEPVLVKETPVIPFLLGTSPRELVYRSGSGSAVLRFEYQPTGTDSAGLKGTLMAKLAKSSAFLPVHPSPIGRATHYPLSRMAPIAWR